MTDLATARRADKVHAESDVPPRLPLRYFEDIEPHLGGGGMIAGVLERHGLSLIYGETGSRKTFLALDMGFAIARGEAWFGRAVTPSPVIYLAAEAGKSFANRVCAYRLHHGLEDARTPFAMIETPVDLRDPAGDTATVIERIKEAAARFETPVALIVVDTLSRAMNGGDENAPTDMGQLVANLDRIRAKTGAHVLCVHHSGKDQSRGARGHSLLRAAVDTEIEVTASEDSSFSTATIRKQRELPTEGEFSFGLEVVEIATGRDGAPLTSCVVSPLAASPAGSKRKTLSPTNQRALNVLHNAVAEHGEPAPEAIHYPSGARVISVETWRDALFKSGILDKDARNPREPFRRARGALVDGGYMAEWDGKVWPVTETQAARKSATMKANG